jgi:hypothetical protein
LHANTGITAPSLLSTNVYRWLAEILFDS